LLAAACSQLLGIDGRYSRDEAARASGGQPEMTDSGAGGSTDQVPATASATASGGTAGEAQIPLVLPPATPGAPPPHLGRDAGVGRSPCAEGYKVCGDVCTAMTPAFGCGGPRCDACIPHANAHTSCGMDGACESICNEGFVPMGADCIPKGSGGTPSRGGAGGSPSPDAGSGGGGSTMPEPCDPLQCPTCNRGFEGCCIPAGPDGTPSRCGCFYLPLLCTTKVPG
jgi:hypothetical protein